MSKSVTRLLRILTRLRSPKGCPWDRKQTHESLITCLEEESWEVAEAIRQKDVHGMREELGDLLLHIVFHCQIAKETGSFDFDDVVQTLTRKLVRRHPHVFGRKKLRNQAAVLKQWHAIKAREKKDRRYVRNRKRLS